MTAAKCPVRLSLALLAPLLILAGCGGGNREEKALASISKDFIESCAKTSPTAATFMGDHRYDDRLEDMGAKSVESYLIMWLEYRERLRAIDRSKLGPASAVDAEYLAQQIDFLIMNIEEERSFERNPMLYVEILSHSIYSILSQHSAPLETRLDRIAARLEQYPRLIAQATENLKNPPKLRTETAIEMTKGLVAFLDNDLRHAVDEAGGNTNRVKRAIPLARDALLGFQRFFESDLVNRSFGEIRLGDRLYQKRFTLMLGTDMTPDEMVDAAYRDIEAIHTRMYTLAAPIYEEITGTKAPPDPDVEQRARIIKAVLDEIANDHSKPGKLLDACKAAFDEAAAFVRERDIVGIPDMRLNIELAPTFLRAMLVVASQAPGPLEKSKDYYYLVSPVPDYFTVDQTERFLREYNNQMIRLLTIHEAMPGHFVQLAYSNRNPSILRVVFPSPTLLEGWATYAQNMMVEEGFRGGDPRLRITADKYYLRVVVNAILDSGMHRENMQEEEAVRIITQYGFQDPEEALIKWRRRIGTNSCYLSSYYIGAREIQEMRDEAELRWKEDFSLRKFHERLLGEGSIPPKYIRTLMFRSDKP